MTIVSKETEIQDRISTVYDNLITEKESIYEAFLHTREHHLTAHNEILAGFFPDGEWEDNQNVDQQNFVEYDIYCYLVDIISDYRDIEGGFPEYLDMIANLEQVMLKFARRENYEVSAIIKRWLQKLIDTL